MEENLSYPSTALTFGEILDRAVTMLAKNFVVLLLIVAIVQVPIAIFSHLTLPPTTDYLRGIAQFLAHPSAATWQNFIVPTHNAPLGGGVATLVRFVNWVLYPLSNAAVIAAIAALWAGNSVTPGNVYQLALKRWGQFIVVAIVYFVLTFVVLGIIGMILAFGSAIIGGSLFALQAKVAGTIATVLFALIIIALGIAPVSWLLLTSYFSYVELIVSESNPFTAISKAYRRVFARGFRVRSLIESLAVNAVFIGSWIISLFASVLLFNLGQQSFVIDVVATIISLITTLIVYGFVTVAYFDTTARLAAVEPTPVTV